MDDRKELFIKISIYSAIVGAGLGVLAVIPIINLLAIIVMGCFASVLVTYYMQDKKIIGELTMKGGAVLGALIGIISACCFLFMALPLFAILSYVPFIKSEYSFVRYLWQLSWMLFPMLWIVVAPINGVANMGYLYVRETLLMFKGSKAIKNQKPDFFKDEEL